MQIVDCFLKTADKGIDILRDVGICFDFILELVFIATSEKVQIYLGKDLPNALPNLLQEIEYPCNPKHSLGCENEPSQEVV